VVVVTNSTQDTMDIDLQIHVPQGSVAIQGTLSSAMIPLTLPAFSVKTHTFYFYFPTAGTFSHYPAHAFCDGQLLGFVSEGSRCLQAVDHFSVLNTQSWDYIASRATLEELLRYLERENLLEVNLSKIAWRCREKKAFAQIVQTLSRRCLFDGEIYGYALLHDEPFVIRECFPQWMTAKFGPEATKLFVDTPLFIQDPFYSSIALEQVDFYPLVHGRFHAVGERVTRQNSSLNRHYLAFLRYLVQKPERNDLDSLVLAYFLTLFGRLNEAAAVLQQVTPHRPHAPTLHASGSTLPCAHATLLVTEAARSVTSRVQKFRPTLQWDYLQAFLALAGVYPLNEAKENEHEMERGAAFAQRIIDPYLSYRIPRWQRRFQHLHQLLQPIITPRDSENPQLESSSSMDKASSSSSSPALTPGTMLEVSLREAENELHCDCRGLQAVSIEFFLLDIELLFSNNPFAQDRPDNFMFVAPHGSWTAPVEAAHNVIAIPAHLREAHAMIEIRGIGTSIRKNIFHFAHTFRLFVQEEQCQLVVLNPAGGPLIQQYVKVYVKKFNGTVAFYKDGYTDLRGSFEYGSVSTTSLSEVARFALLIVSDTHGAMIREVAPPPN